MRKAFVFGLAGIALAGCVTASEVSNTVREIQNHTRTICNYVPYAETITKVLARSTVIDTAFGLATEFCAAVTTVPLAEGPGKRQPMVRGVAVRGKFVK